MCCRLNIGSTSFDRTAADLLRAAQIELSGETVRTIVMDYGQRVLVAQGNGLLATSFTAADCKVRKSRPARKQEHTAAVIDRTTPAANGSADSSVSSPVDNLADEASQPKTGPQSTEYGTLPTHPAPDATVEDAVTATSSRTEQNADAEAPNPPLVEEEITRMYLARHLPFGLRRFIAAFPSTQIGKTFLAARCKWSSFEKGRPVPQGKAAMNCRTPN